MFKHMILPENFNEEKLTNAVHQLLQRAIERHNGNAHLIEYCGSEKCWTDCCTGIELEDGRYMICFQYNIREENNIEGDILGTLAITDYFNIK